MLSNIDFSNDNLIKDLTIEEIYKNYGRVLVLCSNNSTKIKPIGELKTFGYSLIPMPVSMIKNTFIKKYLHVMDYEELNKQFYIDRTYFTCVSQKELVLDFLNFNTESFKSFSMQFNGVCTFKDYLVATVMNDYMSYTTTNEILRLNRINMLQTINERSYWSLFFNCRLNISLQFIQRGFNLSLIQRLENNQIKDIIQKINKYSVENDDYLSYLYRKQIYVDAASNLKEQGYKLYRITKGEIDDIMDVETFNKFLAENVCMNEKEFYYLVMNLLSSKELCHLIINNKEILFKLKTTSFYSKYYYIFKYLLSYAWLTFYLEESIKKKKYH